ncbi:hypothetical protein [Thauera butanivorans]|uniref:hypothetical protein n=1 Tax=Thauera butanivorans TaxID=86174 RepID=UPI00083964C7|nr:hypothetical protein [Thauera butanivorans]
MTLTATRFPAWLTRRNAFVTLSMLVVTFAIASVAQAVDLTALDAIGGPLATALTQLSNLTPGMKALVGFLAFAVAFVSLAALRNMGPIMLYIGVAIFGAVGLAIGGAILGATI